MGRKLRSCVLKSGERGASVIVMVMLMLAVSLTFTLAGYGLMSGLGDQTTGKGDYDKASEMAKGIGDFAEKVINEYYRNTLEPDPTQIEDILKVQLPAVLVAASNNKYRMLDVKLTSVEDRSPSVVGFSAFRGMIGPQKIIDLSLKVAKSSGVLNGEDVVSELKLTLAIASIHLFKFTLFTTESESFSGAAYLTMQGRVHSNGDVCMGSRPNWGLHFYQNVTAAGKFRSASDSVCGFGAERYDRAYISITDSFDPPVDDTPVAMIKSTEWRLVTKTGVSGCENCDGTGLNWPEFARKFFKGHVQDSLLGVEPLLLPGTKVTAVQPGAADDVNDPAISNQGFLRMLVDPVRQGDDKVIMKSKISYKADLRIVNGVWYIRDEANPDNWPGLPIWSDHPGHFSENGVPVGQEDIRARLQGTDQQWPAGETPKRFSYYEYKNGVGLSDTDKQGILSYGSLTRVQSRPYTDPEPWEPAQWVDSTATGGALCNAAGGMLTCGAGGCGFMSVFNQSDALKKMRCNAVAPAKDPSLGSAYLNASRSGVIDPILRYYSKDPMAEDTSCSQPKNDDIRYNRSKILPTNFNVGQFQQALVDAAPGELGSFFINGRHFNGIVFITVTWPKSDDNYNGTELPAVPPTQGDVADGAQIARTSVNSQQALPFPLCSTDLAGQSFDSSQIFKIPSCAKYDPADPAPILAYPNAVRIFNGRSLNAQILTTGLTIASNMPTSIMGDYNTAEYEKDPKAFMNMKDSWVAALVAGDIVENMSSNWSDEAVRWSYRNEIAVRYCDAEDAVPNPLYVGDAVREAAYSTQITSILTSRGSQSMESGKNSSYLRIGSHVEGFRSVYAGTDAPRINAHKPRIYTFDERARLFDPHLDFKQPPGSPSFSVVGSLKVNVE